MQNTGKRLLPWILCGIAGIFLIGSVLLFASSLASQARSKSPSTLSPTQFVSSPSAPQSVSPGAEPPATTQKSGSPTPAVTYPAVTGATPTGNGATPTPKPTVTKPPSPTPTPSPIPTPSPTPSPIPTPTPSPTP